MSLQPVVFLHFDNHPLAARPVFMDDNYRPHHSMAVIAYLQNERSPNSNHASLNTMPNVIVDVDLITWDV
jgi:hypothetical protein